MVGDGPIYEVTSLGGATRFPVLGVDSSNGAEGVKYESTDGPVEFVENWVDIELLYNTSGWKHRFTDSRKLDLLAGLARNGADYLRSLGQ